MAKQLKDYFSSPRGTMYLIALLMLATGFATMVLMEVVIKPVYGTYLPEVLWDLSRASADLDRHTLYQCLGCAASGKAPCDAQRAIQGVEYHGGHLRFAGGGGGD